MAETSRIQQKTINQLYTIKRLNAGGFEEQKTAHSLARQLAENAARMTLLIDRDDIRLIEALAA